MHLLLAEHTRLLNMKRKALCKQHRIEMDFEWIAIGEWLAWIVFCWFKIRHQIWCTCIIILKCFFSIFIVTSYLLFHGNFKFIFCLQLSINRFHWVQWTANGLYAICVHGLWFAFVWLFLVKYVKIDKNKQSRVKWVSVCEREKAKNVGFYLVEFSRKSWICQHADKWSVDMNITVLIMNIHIHDTLPSAVEPLFIMYAVAVEYAAVCVFFSFWFFVNNKTCARLTLTHAIRPKQWLLIVYSRRLSVTFDVGICMTELGEHFVKFDIFFLYSFV